MTNKKITDVNKIIKIKENVIKAFDNKIDRLNMENTLKSLNESSLGLLVNIFENISDKLYESVKGRRLIKRYVSLFKENNEMKNAYAVNNTLNKVVSESNVSNKENLLETTINLSNNLKRKRLSESKQSLVTSDIKNDELVAIIEAYNNNVNKSIDYIVENNLSSSNVIKYNNAVSVIKDSWFKENEGEVVTENTNYGWSDLEKLISECSTEWHKELLKDISVCTIKNVPYSQLFERYKSECLSIINESKEDKSIEELSELELMESRLTQKQYNEETSSDDLLKLSELKYTLRNE